MHSVPLDLPRLVMRRARIVAIGFLLLTLVLGWLAARRDTRTEIEGAMALAQAGVTLGALPADDASALAALQRQVSHLRHVRLQVADAARHVLFDSAPASPLAGDVVGGGQRMAWQLARPASRPWTATLIAAPESEEREATVNLLGLFALLAGCCVLTLAVMQWNVRRAFRPLQALLGGIGLIERHDMTGVRCLPPMPIRELEVVSQALKQLASSLEQAEASRRSLTRKLFTLQEDERQRLARDLHDEFGQRLTALRVDAAWLRKRLADDAPMRAVVDGMSEQISHVQGDVRNLLSTLRPSADAGLDGQGLDTAGELARVLEALAASWSRPAAGALHCTVGVARRGRDASLADIGLPRDVVMAVYRISQEAFTNAARHGGATLARIDVQVQRIESGALVLDWCASDNGSGLDDPGAALQRGNGLAGMKERVWALGGRLEWSGRNPPPMRGLELRARFVGVAEADA